MRTISTSPVSSRVDAAPELIRPPGMRGAAFGTVRAGDGRSDESARRGISRTLQIPEQWAYARQVHGSGVAVVAAAGLAGDADALVTTTPGLPLTVATADCLPIVIESQNAVAVVHAGWRGIVAGVIPATLEALSTLGEVPLRAAIGPGIGPCCYEVGPDVLERFSGFTSTTTSGSPSVDLPAAAAARLARIEVWVSDRCTATDPDLHSYRVSGTHLRQVAVGWLPKD